MKVKLSFGNVLRSLLLFELMFIVAVGLTGFMYEQSKPGYVRINVINSQGALFVSNTPILFELKTNGTFKEVTRLLVEMSLSIAPFSQARSAHLNLSINGKEVTRNAVVKFDNAGVTQLVSFEVTDRIVLVSVQPGVNEIKLTTDALVSGLYLNIRYTS